MVGVAEEIAAAEPFTGSVSTGSVFKEAACPGSVYTSSDCTDVNSACYNIDNVDSVSHLNIQQGDNEKNNSDQLLVREHLVSDTNIIAGHIQPVIDALPAEMEAEQRRRAEAFIQVNSELFSKSEYDIGRTNLVPHVIDTGSHRPIKQPLRRHPFAHLEVIDQTVADMLRHDIIEPAASPWASNVVLVRKSSGQLRFCLDYRSLNSVTYKDSYPLPRIDTCLDSLGGSKIFSTLDLRSGYWQARIDPASADKTAFVTRKGTFRFKVLSFGLSNAPALFQRLMDLVLAGLAWDICLVYLDDIIVMSETFDRHLERLEAVFDRLRRAGLKLHPSKSRLFQVRTKFLGHIVSGEGISPDEEKIRAVRDWPTPSNLTEARGFVALASYYRRFIEGFADIARPLHELTRKGVAFEWTHRQQEAFEHLKHCLISAPVLATPKDHGMYVLDSDASNEALGLVLQQEQDGVLKVIAYASRALLAAERSYCTTRKEMLAVIYGLKHFRQFLLGRHFVCRTDHAALTSLFRTPEPVGQQARYLDLLGEYDMEIVHRPGSAHGNSDALSRRPCERADESLECRQCHPRRDQHIRAVCRGVRNKKISPTSTPIWDVSPDVLRTAQRSDEAVGFIIRCLEILKQKPDWAEVEGLDLDTQNLYAQWEVLELRDGVLYRRFERPDGTLSRFQLVVPTTLRVSLLRQLHGGKTSGHFGVAKTQDLVRQFAYWRGWMADVQLFVQRCDLCCRYRRWPTARHGELQPSTANRPFVKLHVDLTGPHLRSKNGYVYLLTAIDYFTKYLVCVPIRDKTALSVAKALVKNVYLIHGSPDIQVSDQSREFQNELMTEIAKLLGIQLNRTCAYRPSSNGAIERTHRTINSVFAKVVDTNQRNWCEMVPYVTFAYNNVFHSSTTFSPFFLLYLREARLPLDLALDNVGEEMPSYSPEYVEVMNERMRSVYKLVRDSLQSAFSRSKQTYDARVKRLKFIEGDLVWYFCPRKQPRLGPKWQLLTTGPWRIQRVINAVNFVIKRVGGKKELVANVDRLRRYQGPEVDQGSSAVSSSIAFQTEVLREAPPAEAPLDKAPLAKAPLTRAPVPSRVCPPPQRLHLQRLRFLPGSARPQRLHLQRLRLQRLLPLPGSARLVCDNVVFQENLIISVCKQ